MTDGCPICGAELRFELPQPGSLERRRFPRGRLVCQGDLKPWHLSLERLMRELDVTRDDAVKVQLRGELEDILIQHVHQPSNLEHSTLFSSLAIQSKITQPLEETA